MHTALASVAVVSDLLNVLFAVGYAALVAVAVISAGQSVRFGVRLRRSAATKQDRRLSVGSATYALLVLLFLEAIRAASAGVAPDGVPPLLTGAARVSVVAAITLAACVALATSGPYRHVVAERPTPRRKPVTNLGGPKRN